MPAEDLVYGYKQLWQVERVHRDLKHTVDVRPMYHRLDDRIRSHVLLCWLALLMIRVAENETGQTWRQMRDLVAPSTWAATPPPTARSGRSAPSPKSRRRCFRP
ncbi:hypothetical protein VLY81_13085 [Geochorda subterranea]|uniref:DDE family transposase n=1 Tax=Geochorda subterranea TaxID=3109564 RepID=A0ABZ1BNE5_9FIRM|nr:hypothetical protein [Limnochorda sp. LNt]WRP14336.1 hypothetical protein VLY81_13085 [Limnochorda sp. LNt]